MAVKNNSVDLTGGYNFQGVLGARHRVSGWLLKGNVLDKGEIRSSPGYSDRFPAAGFSPYDRSEKQKLKPKIMGRDKESAEHYDGYLQGLGDDTTLPTGGSASTAKKTKFGRTRTGITGVPAIDEAIFSVQDDLSDLQTAMTIQTAAAVFSLLGIGWLIVRRR